MVVSGALSAFFDFLGGSIESVEPHLQAFRFKSRRAWAITWVLVLTTTAIGLVELQGGGPGPLGVSMLALAVVGVTGQLLAGRPPTDVRTEKVENRRRHPGKET